MHADRGSGQSLRQSVEQLEAESGLDRKAALKQAARERGLAKREAYKQLLLETVIPAPASTKSIPKQTCGETAAP